MEYEIVNGNICGCVCACVCVRACVRSCVCVYVFMSTWLNYTRIDALTHTRTNIHNKGCYKPVPLASQVK